MLNCGQSAGKDNTLHYHQTKALAYLIGAYLTDGNVSKVVSTHFSDWYVFELQVRDKDFAIHVADCLKRTLRSSEERRKVTITKSDWHMYNGNALGPVYRVKAYSYELAYYLIDQCKIKSRVPPWLRNAKSQYKRAFVAGVMDGDGSIFNVGRQQNGYPKSTYIELSSGMKWRKSFIWIIKSLGVILNNIIQNKKISKARRKQWISKCEYVFRFVFNVRSFVKAGCYFTIERKQKKLRFHTSSVL